MRHVPVPSITEHARRGGGVEEKKWTGWFSFFFDTIRLPAGKEEKEGRRGRGQTQIALSLLTTFKPDMYSKEGGGRGKRRPGISSYRGRKKA